MDIRIDHRETLFIVRASGEIDAITCGGLEKTLNGLIDTGGTRIVLDLSATAHISSAGLKVLLGAAKRLHGVGRFVISGAGQEVLQILEMAGFTHIIDVYGTSREAASAIEARED